MSVERKEVNDYMPIWVDDSHISPEWMQQKTGIKGIMDCKVLDISNQNKRSECVRDGTTLRLHLEVRNAATISKRTLILKQATEKGSPHSKRLGLARESLFYDTLANNLPTHSTPTIFYSYGDFESGKKCIIMEDIQNSIDSGILFGPGNPNNWKRNLPELIANVGTPTPTSKEVALVTFKEIAKIHAIYWKRPDLLSHDKTWLRGQEWIRGKGKEKWETSQNIVRLFWKKFLDVESNNKNENQPMVKWDTVVRSAVEKAVNGISWEAQLERLNTEEQWTLVHGDFWPGNVMWITKDDDNDGIKKSSIRFLDWEMVGLGSGLQDLGQYVISNMNPAERKENEYELVQAYFHELMSHNDSINLVFEQCWEEYKIGAVERWMWFLVYFVGNGMIDWGQYFHDQISSFMMDHKITAQDITQPRP